MIFPVSRLIAKQEFIAVLTHPIVILVTAIIIILAYLNGVGGVGQLDLVSQHADSDLDLVYYGIAQAWNSTTLVCIILSAFLGATSISEERWKNSMNVLLTKPLYKRDIFVGKFVGLSMFALFFNTFIILMTSLLVILSYHEPRSAFEFLCRIVADILAFSMTCSVVIALCMLISVISKNILVVTACSMIYIFTEFVLFSNVLLKWVIYIKPMWLYGNLIGVILLDYPLDQGFYQDVGILLIELIICLSIGIYLFVKADNT